MRPLTCLLLLVAASACGAQGPANSTAGKTASLFEPGKDWEMLGSGFQLTADSAVDAAGNVFFTDARRDRIWKVDATGKIAIWKEKTGTHGITLGPDGRLYAGQHGSKRIVAYSMDGRETVVAEGAQTHHLTVSQGNLVYFSDAPNHAVWRLNASGKRQAAATVDWPRAVRFGADARRLMVTDARKGDVLAFQVKDDGSLTNGAVACRLSGPGDRSEIDPGGLAFDTEGRMYVATYTGVQVCDARGKVVETIPVPGSEGTASVFFAGPDFRWLYVTDGDGLFRRRVTRQGVKPKLAAQ